MRRPTSQTPKMTGTKMNVRTNASSTAATPVRCLRAVERVIRDSSPETTGTVPAGPLPQAAYDTGLRGREHSPLAGAARGGADCIERSWGFAATFGRRHPLRVAVA